MKLKVFKNNFLLCLLTFIFCIVCFGGTIVFSANAQSIDANQPYFYSLLNNDNAKKFYQAIAKSKVGSSSCSNSSSDGSTQSCNNCKYLVISSLDSSF